MITKQGAKEMHFNKAAYEEAETFEHEENSPEVSVLSYHNI